MVANLSSALDVQSPLLEGNLLKNAAAVGVIMAGGSGTRFWPSSRRVLPKQFLSLVEQGPSLLQMTAQRFDGLLEDDALLVVGSYAHRELVRSHLPRAAVLSEPLARNTAPCLAFAAALVQSKLGDVPMLCVPADHLIGNEPGLKEVFRQALEVVTNHDVLAAIGVAPSQPETGYGYIRSGEELTGCRQALHVREFVEKPDYDRAVKYCMAGDYFWNSGMFAWRPSVLLRAVDRHLPGMSEAIKKVVSLCEESDAVERCREIFSLVQEISIDYGVLEKESDVVVIPGRDLQWSDVGSWDSWASALSFIDEGELNQQANVVQADALLINSRDCMVRGSKRFIAGVGLEHLVIIDTDDALLVCNRKEAQRVREVVAYLRKEKREKLL